MIQSYFKDEFQRFYCVCLLLKGVLKFMLFLMDKVTLIVPSVSVVEKLSGDEKIFLIKFTDFKILKLLNCQRALSLG